MDGTGNNEMQFNDVLQKEWWLLDDAFNFHVEAGAAYLHRTVFNFLALDSRENVERSTRN